MFFKKKKKDFKENDYMPEEELVQIMEKKSKEKKKLDNVSDELIAQAIKDLLSKE